jgi:hypothetical protein
MQPVSTIRYLQHKEINKIKWDECIRNAENSLIYAQSFYLDAMSPGWDAIVEKNYNWVLPITKRRKFGINYLYQPNFTQQLGVFFKKDANLPWQEIIRMLQQKFSFWEDNWNFCTDTDQLPSTLQKSTATNFIIDLSCAYTDIASNYHNVLKKNLKRAKNAGLKYATLTDYRKAVKFYKKYYSYRMPHVKDEQYAAFTRICETRNFDDIVCREAVDLNGQTMSIALLLSDGYRLYNIMDTTTAEGKKAQANHFLIDSVIEEFSETKLLFDFEGSDLAGVKNFYQAFGAINQPYYSIRYNNLIWPLRLLKR